MEENITLGKIYEKLGKIELDIELLNDKLDWANEFSEEENKEFEEGTREAWKEIEEGRYARYNSTEEFLESFK